MGGFTSFSVSINSNLSLIGRKCKNDIDDVNCWQRRREYAKR